MWVNRFCATDECHLYSKVSLQVFVLAHGHGGHNAKYIMSLTTIHLNHNADDQNISLSRCVHIVPRYLYSVFQIHPFISLLIFMHLFEQK